ncbi:hypothetical protein BGP_6650 [Beggiatoa sp. PS]|nr:hypothetical protein BGP_6650 [Beggiatoa sp. PS]
MRKMLNVFYVSEGGVVLVTPDMLDQKVHDDS